MTLVLFDLDGTLLRCRVGSRLFTDACSEVVGRAVVKDTIPFAGGTDPRLFAGVCESHDLEPRSDLESRFRRRYVSLMAAADLDGETEAIAGAAGLVDALGERGATLGVLTGNYRESGRMKLRAAGFDPDRFAVAVFGDDGATRRDLPPVALERYRDRFGEGISASAAVIVGDTPRDVDCARHHGLRSLAVATGSYGRAELLCAGADRVVDDLLDVERIADWLLGGATT